MKGNRQIGLDGRVFISDCLNDSIFFIYSIILSGVLSAVGDVMKLLGKSSQGMDELTNGVVVLDLICSLGMIIVAYYVYFMHCGENVPKLGTKPLIYLEYIRLAYYGLLVYFVLYRFAYACQNSDDLAVAVPIFYFVYLAWLVTCVFAAMFILTLLHQNMIRRSYERSFKWLSLTGLVINVVLPVVYFVTRIWVRGWGDGFYSAGFCDFIRLCIAPIFYSAVWFLYMNAIDQVQRVFGEVDNAIRDKRYHIEFEDHPEEEKDKVKKAAKLKKSAKAEKNRKDKIKKPKKKKSKKEKNIQASNVSAEETILEIRNETFNEKIVQAFEPESDVNPKESEEVEQEPQEILSEADDDFVAENESESENQ